ncbi:hypothetical protein LINPERHAP1_LOCUS4310 [Linum perenne]
MRRELFLKANLGDHLHETTV